MAFVPSTITIPDSDEHVVELETGGVVAVSVISRWLAGGQGVNFIARARLVCPQGSALVSPHGDPIETAMSHTADAATIAAHGVPALARELLLAVLGEAPTIIGKPSADGPDHDEPLIPWSDDVRHAASIRHGMICVDQLHQGSDARSLLA